MDKEKKKTLNEVENKMYLILSNITDYPLSDVHHCLRALEIIQKLKK